MKIHGDANSGNCQDRQLTGRLRLVGHGVTMADIALLAYSHVAHEGGFDLASRPNLRAWIARGENQLNLALAA